MEYYIDTLPDMTTISNNRQKSKKHLFTALAAAAIVALLIGSVLTFLTVQQGQKQGRKPTSPASSHTVSTQAHKETSLYVVVSNGVYDIKQQDGSTIWQYPFDTATYQVQTSQLSDNKETLYVIVYNLQEKSSYLDAFDLKHHSLKWEVKVADNLTATQIVEEAGTLYISGYSIDHTQAGKIFALSATNGSIRWSIDASGNLGSVAHGLLYTTDGNQLLTYHITDGTSGWSKTLDDSNAQFSTAAYVSQNITYVVSCNQPGLPHPYTFSCNLDAYNATTGAVLWQSETIDKSVGTVVIGKNYAYVTTHAYIYAFDVQNGKLVWTQSFNNGVESLMDASVSMIESNNVVYASYITSNGKGDAAAAFNAKDGTQLWTQQVSDDTHLMPMPRPVAVDESQHLVYYATLISPNDTQLITSLQARSTTNGELQNEYKLPQIAQILSAFLWTGSK